MVIYFAMEDGEMHGPLDDSDGHSEEQDYKPVAPDLRWNLVTHQNTRMCLSTRSHLRIYEVPVGVHPIIDDIHIKKGHSDCKVFYVVGPTGDKALPELDQQPPGSTHCRLKAIGPDGFLVVSEGHPRQLQPGADIFPTTERFQTDDDVEWHNHSLAYFERDICQLLTAHGERLGHNQQDGGFTLRWIEVMAEYSCCEYFKSPTLLEEIGHNPLSPNYSLIPGSLCIYGRVRRGAEKVQFRKDKALDLMMEGGIPYDKATKIWDMTFNSSRTLKQVKEFYERMEIPYSAYTADVFIEAWLGSHYLIAPYDHANEYIKEWHLEPAEVMERRAAFAKNKEQFQQQQTGAPYGSASRLQPLERVPGVGDEAVGGLARELADAYEAYRALQEHLQQLAKVGLRFHWLGDPMTRRMMRIKDRRGRVFKVKGPLPPVPFGPLAFELKGIYGTPLVGNQPHPRVQLAAQEEDALGHPCWIYCSMGQVWQDCQTEVQRLIRGNAADQREAGECITVRPQPEQLMPPSWRLFPPGTGTHPAYGDVKPAEVLPPLNDLFWDVQVPMEAPQRASTSTDLGPA